MANVLGRAPVNPYFAQGQQIVHYQWKFVSSLLKNSKNEEIVFPVNDDRDRRWARRLEWAIEEHLDRAKADMDQLQTDFEQVLPFTSVQGGSFSEVLSASCCGA